MPTHDDRGVLNPEYVLASSRADDLLSEALLAVRNGDFKLAQERLQDAARWVRDLAE
jgi:cellobiose-specific phosphotransferase system component IIA